MLSLRVETPSDQSEHHVGDVLACQYTTDGKFILSAGWDGSLRIWDASDGVSVQELQVSSKPLTVCMKDPKGKSWWMANMDGMLIQWDPEKECEQSMFLAHTRPVSSLCFSPDGNEFVTASWDSNISVWHRGDSVDGKIMGKHGDIVAGCQYSPDGKMLVSWSFDGTSAIWDMTTYTPIYQLFGHNERATAGAISPDGNWYLSGARDGEIKLWDVNSGDEICSLMMTSEIARCFFLLDMKSVVVVDVGGRITRHTFPDLNKVEEVILGAPVLCGCYSPQGSQLAFGSSDGAVHLVTIDKFDSVPLAVTAKPSIRVTATALQRLFGQSTSTTVYQLTCPVCCYSFEIPGEKGNEDILCRRCRRYLKIYAITEMSEPTFGIGIGVR